MKLSTLCILIQQFFIAYLFVLWSFASTPTDSPSICATLPKEEALKGIVAPSLPQTSLALTPPEPTTSREVINQVAREQPPRNNPGVAVMLMYDSPPWMQRRYHMLLTNALGNLPADWKLQLFVKDSPGALRGLAKVGNILGDRTEVTMIPRELGQLRRIEIMVHPWFWESMIGARVLMIGAGAAFCGTSAQDITAFSAYDLVGALWSSNRREERPGDSFSGPMLVTKSSALDALRTYGSERPKNVHEFHGVLRKVVPLEKQAPRKLQAQFALLSTVPSPFATPLIIGGTLANWDTGNRSAMIEECPEIKMIFPALHDSACFGAKSSLDKEACYASLCVTNPKPSGC